ncbi:hypothetical protein POM88_024192 [Heracleum sosnowskyi]|uniref:Uncharacterized protein n=1 Tax=Heracleum sosnowskyi TaxID=360622 RepID=A0AAD8MMM2_9APIA|nr:hypothetical protein POM88_024192 [Heracleum sosnowskyi]
MHVSPDKEASNDLQIWDLEWSSLPSFPDSLRNLLGHNREANPVSAFGILHIGTSYKFIQTFYDFIYLLSVIYSLISSTYALVKLKHFLTFQIQTTVQYILLCLSHTLRADKSDIL